MTYLSAEIQKAILDALDKGKSVEIRRNKEGIVVTVVDKKTIHKIPM